MEPIKFLLKKEIDSKLIEGYEKNWGVLHDLFVKLNHTHTTSFFLVAFRE